MPNDVVWYDSTEVGAPTLNNVAGSLINVLDACLIGGFNLKTVTSLSVSGGVATATCNAHGYSATYGKCIEISGATPAALNGRKAILSVTTNTFTFSAASVADGTASGSVSARRSPLGFTKPHSATNKAIYRSGDVQAYGQMLRVNDTGTSPAAPASARAVMVEAATDIDSITGPGPTESQLSGGMYWNKGLNNSDAKAWAVVGSARAFWLFTIAANPGFQVNFFGDIKSYKADEAYGGLIAGSSDGGDGGASNLTVTSQLGGNNFSDGFFVSRRSIGLGSACRAASLGISSGDRMGASAQIGYPSPVDNGMVIHRPVYVCEESATFRHPIRGELPGLAQPLAYLDVPSFTQFSSVLNFAGTLMAVRIYNGGSASAVLLDITGPW